MALCVIKMKIMCFKRLKFTFMLSTFLEFYRDRLLTRSLSFYRQDIAFFKTSNIISNKTYYTECIKKHHMCKENIYTLC